MGKSAIPVPGKRKLYYPSIGIVTDTSYSMVTHLPSVMNHIATIATETGNIDRLLGGDIRKTLDMKNVTKKDISKLEWGGFGGTSLKPLLLEIFKNKLDIVIVVTDMLLNNEDISILNNVGKGQTVIICIPEKMKQFRIINTIHNKHVRTIYIDED